MADAIHSPTAVEPFPHERVSELVWQAAEQFSGYCRRKHLADSAAEYLALEGLACAFEDLFRALDHLDPRFGADLPGGQELRVVD